MFDLCNYRDIFGKPNKGVHSYRIFNIAIVDTVLTLVAAMLINKYYFNKEFLDMNVLKIFLVLLIISIGVHKLFCVKTTLTNVVFKDKTQ